VSIVQEIGGIGIPESNLRRGSHVDCAADFSVATTL
jgi:hypothetical protein